MAIVGTLKTFKGGHYFKNFEGSPEGSIVQGPLPQRVKIPLRNGFGEEVVAVVAVGDKVKTGQILARSDERVSTPIQSPISGEIIALTEGPHPLDGKITMWIEVKSDGLDEWHVLDLPEGNFERWGADELGRVLYEAGITGLGKSGFPCTLNSAPIEPDKVNTLVINCVETEPYLEAPSLLLYDEFEKFVNGIKVLKGALGNIEVHIGIGYDQPHILEELENRMEYHDWLILHPVLPKYPQGEDEVLIKSLLNREIPVGGSAADLGVVVASIHQTIAAYEAAIEAKPYVESVISIGGSAVSQPVNARIRLGTSVSDLLDAYGLNTPSKVILGGPMRGREIDDFETPVLRGTTALTVLEEPKKRLLGGATPGFGLDSYTRIIPPIFGGPRKATTGLNGEERPCIHCGYCVDVCPQNLFPIWIAEAADRGQLEKAKSLDLMACIDCGLCSYVCPSKIPVLEKIMSGKRAIREEMLGK